MREGAVAVLLVVAVLAGAGVGYFIGTSKQSATTPTSTTTSFVTRPGYTETVTQTVTATSSTLVSTSLTSTFINMTATQCSASASLPCGMAAYNQGAFVITNASLTVSPSNNSTSGVLTLTLIHTQEFEDTALSVSIR
jgi:hypothetical protein